MSTPTTSKVFAFVGAPRLQHKSSLIDWNARPYVGHFVHKLIYILAVYVIFTSLAEAKPTILNGPFTARPGDVVSLTGQNFGAARVLFRVGPSGPNSEIPTLKGTDQAVLFQIPKDKPFEQYQVWVYDGAGGWHSIIINAPRAMHFDTDEIADGARFRIFGRNLYLGTGTPIVTLINTQTNAQLLATVDTSKSDPYSLDVTAPTGIVPGVTYQVRVSNGYNSPLAEKKLIGRAAGDDYYKLGLPWGSEFITANLPGDRRVLNITNAPELAIHAVPDGVTDATPAIQAAINYLAAKGGGIVYLPAGTYRLAPKDKSVAIPLKSGVVIKGYSRTQTKILFGPETAQPSSYRFYAVQFMNGTERTGLADLTMVNIDNSGQQVVNAVLNPGDKAQKLFIQRVDWDLGSGRPISLQIADKVAILNSTFRQSKNSHFPRSNGDSGIGPIYISNVTNLTFRNNSVAWASGQNSMNDVTEAVIENNRFTRSASDQIVAGPEQTNWPTGENPKIQVGDIIQRTQGRQLSANFVKNVVIQNNRFEVSDGTLRYNWHDGEVLLSEGGGPTPRADTGTVTEAGTNTVKGSKTFTLYPNSVVSIVSGTGAGQTRKITAYANQTLTVDRPWDIIPAAGDRLSVDVPSMENVIIRTNVMKDNPAGIILYRNTYLNVALVGNRLTDNGGIFLRPDQRYLNSLYMFGVFQNIEINENILLNTKSQFPSYIVANFAIIDERSIWGLSTTALEMRNNRIDARSGTTTYLNPEGYTNNLGYHNPNAAYIENGTVAIAGSILQGNRCYNCPINYALSTGVDSTAIWNAIQIVTPGTSSQFVVDRKLDFFTAPTASTNTIVGNDD
jgi:hypothetical protein